MSGLVSFTFYDWLIETGDLGVGKGLWCPLHIILMCALFLWMIVCFIVFSKHKKFALKVTKITCIIMITFRIGRMILLIATGKNTFLEAMPWHLCHLMAIVFPLCFLTNSKKFFLPILCVTLFGGILTFVFGNYYCYSTFSFLQYESLFLHFCMPTVVIGALASGWFKVDFKDFWQIPLFLIFLLCWAELGNTLNPGSNFLFLRSNGLPFNLFPNCHFYLTYLILVIIITILFILPFVIAKLNGRRIQKSFRKKVKQNIA